MFRFINTFNTVKGLQKSTISVDKEVALKLASIAETNKQFRLQEMDYYRLQKEADKKGSRRIDISKDLD